MASTSMDLWFQDFTAPHGYEYSELLNAEDPGSHWSNRLSMSFSPPDGADSLGSSAEPSTTAGGIYEMNKVKQEPEVQFQSSSTATTDESHDSEPVDAVPAVQTRQRKSRRSSSDVSSNPMSSAELGRKKNRIAASKCRKKRKVEEQQFQEHWRILQVQNTILQDSAIQLRNEILQLKGEIIKHGTCCYPPIQSYLRAAAQQIHTSSC